MIIKVRILLIIVIVLLMKELLLLVLVWVRMLRWLVSVTRVLVV